MEVQKPVMKAYKIMMRALSNESRLDILYSLKDKPKTWTELLFELQINPKSVRDHLAYLRKSGLVKKSEPVGFELTDASKAFLEMSLNDMMKTAKLASEIAKDELEE